MKSKQKPLPVLKFVKQHFCPFIPVNHIRMAIKIKQFCKQVELKMEIKISRRQLHTIWKLKGGQKKSKRAKNKLL
jgi:hypothetical protein